jgi:hypothetical protein
MPSDVVCPSDMLLHPTTPSCHEEQHSNGSDEEYPWSAPTTTAEDIYRHTQTTTAWHPEVPRGLGLQVHYHPEKPAASPLPVSASWSASYEATLPACSMASNVRSDSVVDMTMSYPSPPIVTDSTTWTNLHHTDAAFEPLYETSGSPDHSVYSGSSRVSICESSPYTHSENEYSTAQSPFVKVEDAVDYSRLRHYSLSSNAPVPIVRSEMYDNTMLSANYPHVAYAPAKLESLSIEPQMLQQQQHLFDHSHVEASDDQSPKRGRSSTSDPTCACHVCNRLFQRSYNRKAHMLTHNKDRPRPYKCPEPDCRKAFVRNTDLVRHTKSIHLNIRDHICDMCHRAFPRKDTLRRYVCYSFPLLSHTMLTSSSTDISMMVAPSVMSPRPTKGGYRRTPALQRLDGRPRCYHGLERR